MKEINRHNKRASLLGSLIREGREQAGLSQSKAASKLNISHTYLLRLERGDYDHPDPRTLVRFASLYGIPLADLYAAAGYVAPTELPSFCPYLRGLHPDWPEEAFHELEGHYEYLQQKYS